MKLKVNDTFEQEEKLTTNSEAANDEDVINNEFVDAKLAEVKNLTSYIEKNHEETKDHERSNEKVSIGRAVKTTIQILYD